MRGTVASLCLGGVLYLSAPLIADQLSDLLKKGREAFQSGNYEAAERYHRLAAEEAVRAGEPVHKAEALGDLGGVLRARGRHHEAKAVCLQALEVLRQTRSRQYLPVILNNLGALSSETGEFIEAESYLSEALKVARELDPSDPYIARVLNNFGALHYATEQSGRAKKDFLQAIDLIEKTHGPDRRELVPFLNNLASVYVKEKKWNDASLHFKRALALLKDAPGADMAGVLDSIGSMHFARHKYTESRDAFERGYEIRLKTFGKGHPAVAASAANLASAMIAKDQHAEAEVLLGDALEIYQSRFGPVSLQVAATYDKLADLYRKTNRKEDAVLAAERAKDIRSEHQQVVPASALR